MERQGGNFLAFFVFLLTDYVAIFMLLGEALKESIFSRILLILQIKIVTG